MREGATMKVSHRSSGVGVASTAATAGADLTSGSSAPSSLIHIMDGVEGAVDGSSRKEKKLLHSIDQDNAVLAEVSPCSDLNFTLLTPIH